MTAISDVVTPGEIAKALGVAIHRVRHILETRDQIKPMRRIGIVRVYPTTAIDDVRRELDVIDRKRKGVAL